MVIILVTISSKFTVEFRRVLFIRSTWKLLFYIFSGSWLKSSLNIITTRSITIADYSNLVYLTLHDYMIIYMIRSPGPRDNFMH